MLWESQRKHILKYLPKLFQFVTIKAIQIPGDIDCRIAHKPWCMFKTTGFSVGKEWSRLDCNTLHILFMWKNYPSDITVNEQGVCSQITEGKVPLYQ